MPLTTKMGGRVCLKTFLSLMKSLVLNSENQSSAHKWTIISPKTLKKEWSLTFNNTTMKISLKNINGLERLEGFFPCFGQT